MEQGRIILDKVEPFMRGHATKANSGVGFVLRNLHAQKWCPIHAAKCLEHPVLIAYSNTHWLAHFLSLCLGGLNDPFCRFAGDTGFLEGVFCHRNVLSSCCSTTLSGESRCIGCHGFCVLASTQ